MKKIISITISAIILLIIGFIIYKYVYVPKGEVYRIKYEDLKKEFKGQSDEAIGELTSTGLHTRTSFQKKGDTVIYTFDILNDGTIEAKLVHDPIILGRDNITKTYFTRYLNYKDGELIKKGDIIKPGEKVTIEYKIEYTDQELFSSADGNHFEVSILFPYLQNR